MDHKSILSEDEIKCAILDFHKRKFNYDTKHYDVTVNIEDRTVSMTEVITGKLSFRTRLLASLFGL